MTVYLDRTLCCLSETCNDFNHFGLAVAINACDTEYLASSYLKIKTTENLNITVINTVKVSDFENDFAGLLIRFFDFKYDVSVDHHIS